MENKEMKAADLAVETVETVETELVSRDDMAANNMLQSLVNPKSDMYCSIENQDSQEEKIKIFNAINGNGKKIASMIGKTINLKDVVAHPVQLMDENTGEIIDTVRVVLIDDSGESYAGVSAGIMNSLQKMFMIFGEPKSWDKPIKVEIQQQQTRNGNNKVNTLAVVG